MNLYEIKEHFLTILDAIGDSDAPEEDENLLVALQGINASFEEKIENCAKYVRGVEAEADVIKAEADRLRDKAAALTNKAKRMKQRMHEAMDEIGSQGVKGEHLTIALQNSNPALVVDDAAKIPADYWVAQEPKLDKKKALADAKAVEVPGCSVVRSQHLRIK